MATNQKLFLAIECAKLVLPIYENKYPNDSRPSNAINKAVKHLNNKTANAANAAYTAAAAANAEPNIIITFILNYIKNN